MAKPKQQVPAIADELVISKIHTVRGHKVMLDSDLAELYQVETRRLNEQVKRNIERFPSDFMFELTVQEWDALKSQNATSSWGGRRKTPSVFTEHGVLMLSSVLNSATASLVNIQIMRQFVRMRDLYTNHKELMFELEKVRSTVGHNSRDIKVIFNILNRMRKEEENRLLLAQVAKVKQRPVVGFKQGKHKPER
ncbi:MAG: ORF6N domain-containing protein [Bacteroidetes bacterium]|nr:ORF6N domain-containing protein [Bacteroidota bacterium]MBS1941112.1 ORF6N domain-containing protein [Bacteroidota bacterium]